MWHLSSNTPSQPLLRITAADDMGLSSSFARYPAGWSKNPQRMEHVEPQARAILDQLVRDHIILSAPKILEHLGIESDHTPPTLLKGSLPG